MTLAELEQLYEAGKAIIRAERQARMYVFRDVPAKRKAKVQEMTRLLQLWAQMKDAAKAGCYEQPKLLDAPRRADYG